MRSPVVFLLIAAMCRHNFAQVPPKVSGRTHMQARSNQEYNEVLINTDRFVSSLEHKLSGLFRSEVNGLRSELQRSDHSNGRAETILKSYETLKQSIDNLQAECLQNQIFDNPPVARESNTTLVKLDNLHNLLVSLRSSANRIEKDLAFIKKSSKTMNVKSQQQHHRHSMMMPRNDFYHDHENACTASLDTESGVRRIRKDFFAFCEVTQDDGNWIVIQSRVGAVTNFFRNWNEYKEGFGNVAGGDFWLGLEKIYELTSTKLHEMQIVMEDLSGGKKHAKYAAFAIASEAGGYALNVLGAYSGNSGDAMSYHAGMKFSTFDVDNDEWSDGACAKSHLGGWWYNKCDMCNLNGVLNGENSNELQSVHWKPTVHTTTVLKSVKMMIRPID